MSEEKKEECCGTKGSGSCCGGVKKLIVALAFALIVFTLGYTFGKGYCPFSSSPCQKMCPITQK